MKILIILLMLLPAILFGQNLEPVQQQFYFPLYGDSRYLSGDSAYFQQKKFIMGNHWDSSPRLEKAVGYTQKDIYSQHISDGNYISDSTLLHVKIDEDSFPQFWTHCRGPELLNARGIEYSPILEINPDSAFILHTIPTSSRNPIFGFQTIVGTKSTHLITLSKFHYFSLA